MLLKNNKGRSFKENFEVYLKRQDELARQSTSYNSSNSTTNYSNYYNTKYFYFYEWSNVSGVPKTFNNWDEFEKFLKDCNIVVTEAQKSCIKYARLIYATCKKDSNELMYAYTWKDLSDRFKLSY